MHNYNGRTRITIVRHHKKGQPNEIGVAYKQPLMSKSYTKTGQHGGKQFPLYMNDAPQPSIMQQAFINAVLQ
jgi:hypothetical protein